MKIYSIRYKDTKKSATVTNPTRKYWTNRMSAINAILYPNKNVFKGSVDNLELVEYTAIESRVLSRSELLKAREDV